MPTSTAAAVQTLGIRVLVVVLVRIARGRESARCDVGDKALDRAEIQLAMAPMRLLLGHHVARHLADLAHRLLELHRRLQHVLEQMRHLAIGLAREPVLRKLLAHLLCALGLLVQPLKELRILLLHRLELARHLFQKIAIVRQRFHVHLEDRRQNRLSKLLHRALNHPREPHPRLFVGLDLVPRPCNHLAPLVNHPHLIRNHLRVRLCKHKQPRPKKIKLMQIILARKHRSRNTVLLHRRRRQQQLTAHNKPFCHHGLLPLLQLRAHLGKHKILLGNHHRLVLNHAKLRLCQRRLCGLFVHRRIRTRIRPRPARRLRRERHHRAAPRHRGTSQASFGTKLGERKPQRHGHALVIDNNHRFAAPHIRHRRKHPALSAARAHRQPRRCARHLPHIVAIIHAVICAVAHIALKRSVFQRHLLESSNRTVALTLQLRHTRVQLRKLLGQRKHRRMRHRGMLGILFARVASTLALPLV
eukprot:comp21511_c0_seq1/m.46957 comp21511_c0_seq1/g.46957  ORF comp21511_c0_seq1/g.46957 comp21511_c0_seq1/m.46957 type:complete len:473 (-) comp21511_c0_seq1:1-1419(-)